MEKCTYKRTTYYKTKTILENSGQFYIDLRDSIPTV